MLVEKAKLSRNFLAEMNAKSKVQKTFILFFPPEELYQSQP
jgi:hypothetical protein